MCVFSHKESVRLVMNYSYVFSLLGRKCNNYDIFHLYCNSVLTLSSLVLLSPEFMSVILYVLCWGCTYISRLACCSDEYFVVVALNVL